MSRMDFMKIGSIERVRLALAAADHEDTIFAFPEGTRTAVDAANAAGCDVSQIVKSLVFKSGDQPVLVLTSGSNRVDESKIEGIAGGEVGGCKRPLGSRSNRICNWRRFSNCA